MVIKKILPIVVWLLSVPLLNAQTEWRITGGGVGEEGILLKQNPSNTQEFNYVGPLPNQWFKITDGTTSYVPLCGDPDPLGQTLTLREENNSAETGLRIRYAKSYAGSREYFTVKLNVSSGGKTINVERFEQGKGLLIMGGPFNRRDISYWDIGDAVEMERDRVNPFIFYYRGEIRYSPIGIERGNIKFLLGRTWDDNYHPVGTTDVPLLQASKIRFNGADTKWTIPSDGSADGYYVIKINTLDETIDVDFTPKTAIKPLNRNETVRVYTSKGKLFVQSVKNERLKVNLFGIDGKNVLEKTFTGVAEIPLPGGCYIAKITNAENEVFTTKVIVL